MPIDGVEDILAFYDSRDARARVGIGLAPALVVVDFSRAFTSGHPALREGKFAAEIAQTNRLLAAMRGVWPVFFTTIAYDEPRRDGGLWAVKIPWLETCRSGSPAVEIDPILDPVPGDVLVVKHFPSAFFRTDLRSELDARGVDTVVLTGCTTSVCVRATAIDAMQHGYRTIVAREAVGDFNAKLHAVHLRDLDARYADVMPVDAILARLAELRPL
jgi:nicotinamidase-related amidase